MKEALAFVWSYTKKHGLAYGMAIFLTIVVAGIAMINPYATGMIAVSYTHLPLSRRNFISFVHGGSAAQSS